jgi:C2 domain
MYNYNLEIEAKDDTEDSTVLKYNKGGSLQLQGFGNSD